MPTSKGGENYLFLCGASKYRGSTELIDSTAPHVLGLLTLMRCAYACLVTVQGDGFSLGGDAASEWSWCSVLLAHLRLAHPDASRGE